MAAKILPVAAALTMVATCTHAFDTPSYVELFRDAGFEGPSAEIGTTENSFSFRFNDKVSSLIVSGGPWIFYTKFNFDGEVAILEPGEYPTAAATELPDNSISAMRPFPPPTAASILIFQPGFRGKMVHLIGPTSDFGFIGFDDQASSAIVLSGTWRMFENINFDGEFTDLSPGRYPVAGGDNQLSSCTPFRLRSQSDTFTVVAGQE